MFVVYIGRGETFDCHFIVQKQLQSQILGFGNVTEHRETKERQEPYTLEWWN